MLACDNIVELFWVSGHSDFVGSLNQLWVSRLMAYSWRLFRPFASRLNNTDNLNDAAALPAKNNKIPIINNSYGNFCKYFCHITRPLNRSRNKKYLNPFLT